MAEGEAQEQEEIIGYHLQTASEFLADIGGMGERVDELAVRAAHALATAGRRAHTNGDMVASANLLGRALNLWPLDDLRRFELVPSLANALVEAGKDEDALKLIDEALDAARQNDNRPLTMHLTLARRSISDEEPWDVLAERDAREALSVFSVRRDEEGLAAACRLLADVAWHRGDVTNAETSWRRAAEHAERSSDPATGALDRAWLVTAFLFGPIPVDQAMSLALAALETGRSVPAAYIQILWVVASLQAMRETSMMLGRRSSEAPRSSAILEGSSMRTTSPPRSRR